MKNYSPEIQRLVDDWKAFFAEFLNLPQENKVAVLEAFKSHLINETGIGPNQKKIYETTIECLELALADLT